MLEAQFLRGLAVKNQTLDINISREYCQHLFLSSFYRKNSTESFLLKGGTALRIVFQSPRYSEDLDFSAPSVSGIEDIVLSVLQDLDAEGLKATKIPESKETRSGKGYLAILEFSAPAFQSQIKLNVQQKNPETLAKSSKIVSNEFIPPYTIVYLKDELLLAEKIEAFLKREMPKARDFFDLYFILNDDNLRALVKRDEKLKSQILERLESLSDRDLSSELKQLLPVGFHQLFSGAGFTTQIKRLVDLYL